MSYPPSPHRTASAWRWGLPALLPLVVLLGWPLAVLGSFTAPDAVVEALREPATWKRLGVSTTQAVLSTALSLILGLPVAYALGRLRFPGRGLLRALATLPIALPSVVVGLAFHQLLGPGGWVNLALDTAGRLPIEVTGTLWAILAAHTCFGVAIVVRVTGGAWTRLDPHQAEAARLLGATRGQVLRHVTLPALLPAVTTGAVLVFVYAFTSFGVVLLLGAPSLDTVEVAIYRLAARPGQWPLAAVLSFVQLLVTVTALGTVVSLQPHTARADRPRHDGTRSLRAASWSARGALVLALLVTLATVVLPLAALVAGAFTRDGELTTRHVASLLVAERATTSAPVEAVGWSVVFATGASVAALVLGGTAAIAVARARAGASRILSAALLLPIAVPAVALGFAYSIAANNDVIDLRGWPLLVLIAHTLVAYPLVIRTVLPAARAIDPRLPEAAATLGAAPARAWQRVELPLLSRAIVVGGAFAFLVSIGELGATLLLRGPGFVTAPIAIIDALGRPGADALGGALALATALLGVSVVAFAIIQRSRHRDVSEY